MPVVDEYQGAALADPVPTVPSSASIQKAQALREAIRRKLLDRPEPPVNPYWSVGAD